MQQQTKQQTNYLIRIATPLMTLINQIRHTVEQQNTEKLRAQVSEEIQQFERQVLASGYPQKTVLMARYCLCTAFDEAVLSTPWGAKSVWAQQSLLSLFHKETWGGERFYVLLDFMAKKPRENIDFLEFAYTLLSLGFEGKFYGKNQSVREEVRNRIFYRIRNARPKPDRILCRHWRDQKVITDNQQHRVKVKRLSIVSILVLLIAVIFFNSMTYHKAAKVFNRLDKVAQISPVTTFLQVVKRQNIDRG